MNGEEDGTDGLFWVGLYTILKYYHGRSILSLIIESYRTIIWLMNIEKIRETCQAKPGVIEGFPFGKDVLVFKVMNKMFALSGLDGDPPCLNLKCDLLKADH